MHPDESRAQRQPVREVARSTSDLQDVLEDVSRPMPLVEEALVYARGIARTHRIDPVFAIILAGIQESVVVLVDAEIENVCREHKPLTARLTSRGAFIRVKQSVVAARRDSQSD